MAQIHSNAVVHKSARLADSVVVGPGCVVEEGAIIGENTVLTANVVVGKDVKIGSNNRFFPNSVAGGMPQLLGFNSKSQWGKVVIGDGNIIREQVTIHPSIYADKLTVVGNENLLMIGVHVGHDCVLEDKIVLSNYTQLSGHCKIETGVWFSGMVTVHQFSTVGKWSYATALAGINHDVPPFMVVSGHYPPQIRGVNERGLLRAGLNEEQQEKVSKAYKQLYRKKGALLENAKALSQQDGLDENVKAIVDAIMRSNEHRFGRYLEQFRH